MDTYRSLSHSVWNCKYHIAFMPNCRQTTLYAELGRHWGEVFRQLALQKDSAILEGHLMPDHVHMMIVSTVGRDEAAIRDCIRSQAKEEGHLERMGLWL